MESDMVDQPTWFILNVLKLHLTDLPSSLVKQCLSVTAWWSWGPSSVPKFDLAYFDLCIIYLTASSCDQASRYKGCHFFIWGHGTGSNHKCRGFYQSLRNVHNWKEWRFQHFESGSLNLVLRCLENLDFLTTFFLALSYPTRNSGNFVNLSACFDMRLLNELSLSSVTIPITPWLPKQRKHEFWQY